MGILNNDILSKEYTEKDVPISMRLLYDLGWRFDLTSTSMKPGYKILPHPTQADVTQTLFDLYDCYNPYWMVNVHYSTHLRSEVRINVQYFSKGIHAFNPSVSKFLQIDTSKIAKYMYDNMPIRTWYDLILLDKYLKASQERININVELQKIQHQYQWNDEHTSTKAK